MTALFLVFNYILNTKTHFEKVYRWVYRDVDLTKLSFLHPIMPGHGTQVSQAFTAIQFPSRLANPALKLALPSDFLNGSGVRGSQARPGRKWVQMETEGVRDQMISLAWACHPRIFNMRRTTCTFNVCVLSPFKRHWVALSQTEPDFFGKHINKA